MAGGGTKGGTAYGATDEFGYHVSEDKCDIYDLWATVLHLMGSITRRSPTATVVGPAPHRRPRPGDQRNHRLMTPIGQALGAVLAGWDCAGLGRLYVGVSGEAGDRRGAGAWPSAWPVILWLPSRGGVSAKPAPGRVQLRHEQHRRTDVERRAQSV